MTWYETTAGKSMGPGVRMKRNEAAHKDQISVDAVLCKLRFGTGRGTLPSKPLQQRAPSSVLEDCVGEMRRRVAAGDSDPAQGKATEAPMTVSLTGKEWAAAMVVKQESEAAEKPKKKRKKR